MMFSRAVVTGSEGFIGGHLVDYLLSSGVEVLGIDDMSSGLMSTYESHLSHKNYVGKLIPITDNRIGGVFLDFKPEIVFHLAAKSGVTPSVLDPTFSDFTNVNGSVNLLEASKESGVKRFIFSSSSSIYGGSENIPTKESEAPNPQSPYALQKLTVENYCKLFHKLYGLESISLRYFNIFGPRQRSDSSYAAVIAAFADAEKNGLQPNIYGSGEQFRDFTYVKNVVNANFLAATTKRVLSGESVNIGCGGTISINALCNAICSKNPEYLDKRAGDVFCSQADISYANEIIGYTPKWTFQQGLRDTLDWYAL
jgi:nucleoside-diphosphate-sugar epimerase